MWWEWNDDRAVVIAIFFFRYRNYEQHPNKNI